MIQAHTFLLWFASTFTDHRADVSAPCVQQQGRTLSALFTFPFFCPGTLPKEDSTFKIIPFTQPGTRTLKSHSYLYFCLQNSHLTFFEIHPRFPSVALSAPGTLVQKSSMLTQTSFTSLLKPPLHSRF